MSTLGTVIDLRSRRVMEVNALVLQDGIVMTIGKNEEFSYKLGDEAIKEMKRAIKLYERSQGRRGKVAPTTTAVSPTATQGKSRFAVPPYSTKKGSSGRSPEDPESLK